MLPSRWPCPLLPPSACRTLWLLLGFLDTSLQHSSLACFSSLLDMIFSTALKWQCPRVSFSLFLWLLGSHSDLNMTPRLPGSDPVVHTLLFNRLPVAPSTCPEGISTFAHPKPEIASSEATSFMSLPSYLYLVHNITNSYCPSYRWKP